MIKKMISLLAILIFTTHLFAQDTTVDPNEEIRSGVDELAQASNKKDRLWGMFETNYKNAKTDAALAAVFPAGLLLTALMADFNHPDRKKIRTAMQNLKKALETPISEIEKTRMIQTIEYDINNLRKDKKSIHGYKLKRKAIKEINRIKGLSIIDTQPIHNSEHFEKLKTNRAIIQHNLEEILNSQSDTSLRQIKINEINQHIDELIDELTQEMDRLSKGPIANSREWARNVESAKAELDEVYKKVLLKKGSIWNKTKKFFVKGVVLPLSIADLGMLIYLAKVNAKPEIFPSLQFSYKKTNDWIRETF